MDEVLDPAHARCASSASISHISSKRLHMELMKRISIVSADELASGAGIAANAPAILVPTEALTKRRGHPPATV